MEGAGVSAMARRRAGCRLVAGIVLLAGVWLQASWPPPVMTVPGCGPGLTAVLLEFGVGKMARSRVL